MNININNSRLHQTQSFPSVQDLSQWMMLASFWFRVSVNVLKWITIEKHQKWPLKSIYPNFCYIVMSVTTKGLLIFWISAVMYVASYPITTKYPKSRIIHVEHGLEVLLQTLCNTQGYNSFEHGGRGVQARREMLDSQLSPPTMLSERRKTIMCI